jgi:hypothetical protein
MPTVLLFLRPFLYFWSFIAAPPPHLNSTGSLLSVCVDVLGPKWHSPIGSIPFHRAQKSLDFQSPTPLPLALVMDVARIKSIMHGAV